MSLNNNHSVCFYSDLPAVQNYFDVTDQAAFFAAPDDWTVVVADIVGSTKAVAEGRYRTVNMIGAACITAALGVFSETVIAYVFGGDGATLLIPPSAVDAVCGALGALQSRSKRVFGMELRVGAVPVADIRARGRDVRVAKLALSPGNDLALFSGGGFSLADGLVKSAETGPKYAVPANDRQDLLDISNLSCRWQRLKPGAGTMIALLVAAQGSTQAIRNENYAIALRRIQDVIGDPISHAPANDRSLTFVWPPRGTRLEALMVDGRTRIGRICHILMQAAFQWAGHKYGKKFGDYNAPAYKEELKRNTDFQQFDDMIRFVLDCGDEDVLALRRTLGELEERNLIVYGLHTARRGLMTCLVFDLKTSRHIHFVDADEGGFTLAARELKAKMKG